MHRSSLLYEEKAQTGTEYLIIMGGVIMVVVAVGLFIKQQTTTAMQLQYEAGNETITTLGATPEAAP